MDWLTDDVLKNPQILGMAIQKYTEQRADAHRSYLDSAARVERASEHLADVRRRSEEYVHSQEQNIGVESYGSRVRMWNRIEPAPRMLGVVIGEVIQNLRTALDYLVYALAILDSGSHPTRTQFLIEDTQAGFNGRRPVRLKGLSDSHVASIERLQPFNGNRWLASLRDLSNRDKHRSLTVIGVSGRGEARFGDPIDPGDPQGKVHVDFTPTFKVAFSDETPVAEALEVLESKVRAVVTGFGPAFIGPAETTIHGTRILLRPAPPQGEPPKLHRSIESPAVRSGSTTA